MKRTLLVCLVLAAGAAALRAQEDPYAGTSNPPQDDAIITTSSQQIQKPSAGRPLVGQQAAPTSSRYQQRPPVYRSTNGGQPGTDGGIVQMTPESSYQDPESNLYQPVQPSNRYQPAPVNQPAQTNRYQSTQTDPYYQDAPTSQPRPVQTNRYQQTQTDPYYQDAPTSATRPAQNNQYQPTQTNRYQSTQPDPYYSQSPATSTRPAQNNPYQPAQSNPYQSTQPDPYYQQQAPTKLYRPPSQTNRSTTIQAYPYDQSGQQAPNYQGQQVPNYQSQQAPSYQGQQNGSYYPSGQYDPYYQGGQNNPNYQQQAPNPYTDQRYPSGQPTLNHRISPSYDPDGDIVRPSSQSPYQLAEGTTIRVSLVGRISSSDAVNGQRFRTRVVNDVVQNGQVLIPADSEIDGKIYDISRGHMGSGGSMHLRPETVTLRDGSHYKLFAQVTGAPGAKAHIGTEGTVKAGSRMKRDTVEYGSAMGVGAGTGAYLGGPVGALAGTMIGAGVITVHLLVSHSQATLESGTPMQFTLTQRLNLVPSPYGN